MWFGFDTAALNVRTFIKKTNVRQQHGYEYGVSRLCAGSSGSIGF